MSQADTLPQESCLNAYYSVGDYMDTFSVSLEGREDLLFADIRVLASHILGVEIGWMNKLQAMRDRLVKPLGIKTTEELAQEQSGLPPADRQPGDRIGFFRIYSVGKNELVLGEDDWHQDFRLSIFRRTGEAPRAYATTCCKRHNLFGHAYLALILPFHKKIVSSVLDSAVEQKLVA